MQQNTESGLEHLAKNIFARVGTFVTATAALATAIHQLAHDILLTTEGVVIALAIISSAFVVLWRSSKMEDGKKIAVPYFPKPPRVTAGAVLVIAILGAVPYGIQITNIVIEREQQEKQFAALPFLALTPKPTATPTGTPTLTGTPPPGAPLTVAAQSAQATALAHGSWPLVLSESFTSNTNQWQLGNFTQEFGTFTRKLENGRLWTEMKGKARFIQVIWSNAPRPFSDFYATVDARRVSGPQNADYGVVFRHDGVHNNFYAVVMNDNRILAVQRTSENKPIQLARLDQLSAIKPNDTNRIGVIAQGSHFDVLINDQLITSIDDSNYKDGKVGFWAGVLNADDDAVFEFWNLLIRTP